MRSAPQKLKTRTNLQSLRRRAFGLDAIELIGGGGAR